MLWLNASTRNRQTKVTGLVESAKIYYPFPQVQFLGKKCLPWTGTNMNWPKHCTNFIHRPHTSATYIDCLSIVVHWIITLEVRSLCMMPRECRYVIPLAMSCAIFILTVHGSSKSKLASNCSKSPPLIYWKKQKHTG